MPDNTILRKIGVACVCTNILKPTRVYFLVREICIFDHFNFEQKTF